FLNAAVEFAVVLVAPAGGQEDAIRVLFEELWDGLRAFTGTAQVIQAEFKKNLAGLGFAAGVLQQCWNVWQAQRDAYAGERPGLRHWIVRELQDNTGAEGFPGAPSGELIPRGGLLPCLHVAWHRRLHRKLARA